MALVLILLSIGSAWWLRSFEDKKSQPPGFQKNLPFPKEPENSSESGKLILKSAFLKEYGDPKKSPQNDLETVLWLLNDCQLMFKNFDSFFLPDNQAISTFLGGGNPEGLIWIPSSHPSMSAEGKLNDRFGTPLFFHRSSALKFEVYSAGKDQKMWTADDLVYPHPMNRGEAN